ncbi:RTA1 like protein-domain-containing protein [Xylariaceae sp. FL0804]|nr:RTA1 like protein-domain-containing protein [Xylariaceae sp. FL0804]
MANPTNCISGDCPRVFLTYQPSLAGNAVLLALFAALVPVSLWLGIKYKSPVFGTASATGLALEIVGYIGRILLHSNSDGRGGFIVFLLGTILGPTCICGAMFLVMPRIIAVYGEEFRVWRPVWYPLLFNSLTTICLILEIAGVLISTVQDDSELITIGVRVLVVGLAVQLVALAIFVGHAAQFAIALRTRRHALDTQFAPVFNSSHFKAFLVAFALAITLLSARTAYRIVDIAEGYTSSIAQDETLFLVVDGVLVLLAALLLTVFFPARAFVLYWPQTSARSLSQGPSRPLRHSSVQLSPAYPSPTYHNSRASPAYNSQRISPPYDNRVGLKVVVAEPSPRKANCLTPPDQRRMVDTDALW